MFNVKLHNFKLRLLVLQAVEFSATNAVEN